MNADQLSEAIWYLRPEAQFTFINDDYETIEWIKLEGTAPSKAEINAAIEEINAQKAENEINNAAAKAALLNRLGITADEAKLLLS